jgi:hypothetical protein
VGKISVRFVPEQDAAHLIACLREHVEAQFHRLGSHNSVRVTVEHLGDRWEADPESQLFKMAEVGGRLGARLLGMVEMGLQTTLVLPMLSGY